MKKRILITGSTDGIGKLAAKKLANDENEIILHGRNKSKLDDLAKEISNQTNNNDIHKIVSDLSEFSSVNKMADELNNKFDRIDVLINNAGVYNSNVKSNSQGLQIQFAVNYYAPVILTEKIIPTIRKSEKPRIINLSSAAQSPIDFDVLLGKKIISDGSAYAQSKLAITMWSFYLAEKYPETAVIALNPGSLLDTKMVREAFGKVWSPAEKGADIIVELATEENHLKMSGKYFDNDSGKYGEAHKDAYDKQLINELIKNSYNFIYF